MMLPIAIMLAFALVLAVVVAGADRFPGRFR